MTKDQADQIDWSQRNRVIGAAVGLTPTKVGYYRRKYGKPKATQYAPQQKPRKLQVQIADIDWNKSKRQIATECGVSVQRIYQIYKSQHKATATA